MTLIIPGVEVKVVKEVLPPQLAPSGILGVLGITEKIPEGGVGRVQSWNRFVELFGAASANSMPEAAQALANGVSELVIIPLSPTTGEKSKCKCQLQGQWIAFEAAAAGTWGNRLKVALDSRPNDLFDLKVFIGDDSKEKEVHRNLKNDEELGKSLAEVSSLIRLYEGEDIDSLESTFSKGEDPTAAAYDPSIKLLKNESDVDMVIASIPSGYDVDQAKTIYTAINAHCLLMSKASQGRIGFAQVLGNDEDTIKKNAEALAEMLVSERMVLVAPAHATGAVAGMIGSLDYFQSPTFKPVSLLAINPRTGVETQKALLQKNVVPIVSYQGRGIIVLRGLTSDGDQISVRRVADHAVRGVKSIGELFIGRLNNENGRGALKQNLVAFLMQMEKEGAIVPSTDGSDPAFKVNVYSSQTDFAQGIVRIDMAVRPVRAIDFIYATVLVQI